MAERRMFAKSIIDSDAFLDMPLSTQALYFHLSMRADDDGFVNNPKKIQRMVGCADDDIKLLIAKNFLIPFESGVVVIKHWKIHNFIRKDRYKETIYQNEKSALITQENDEYTIGIPNSNQAVYQADTIGIPSDNQVTYHLDTQVRLGKDSIGKDSIELEKDYCTEPGKPDSMPEPQKAKDDSPIVITMPLNTGKPYKIQQSSVDRWRELYPAVDIMQELRNMCGWLESNRSRRKTKDGMPRFINNWLSKEQNRGGRSAPYGGAKNGANSAKNRAEPEFEFGIVL